MLSLEKRLAALEQRSASQQVPSGLGDFYGLQDAVDKVGGAKALLARLDSGTATDDDRAALAGRPDARKAVRWLLQSQSSLAHFYGGNGNE